MRIKTTLIIISAIILHSPVLNATVSKEDIQNAVYGKSPENAEQAIRVSGTYSQHYAGQHHSNHNHHSHHSNHSHHSHHSE